MTHKVLYNSSYGMFGFSVLFVDHMLETTGLNPFDLERHDPRLIKAVEEYCLVGASNDYCSLAIEEINCNQYRIFDYDGKETVITPETDNIEWITID